MRRAVFTTRYTLLLLGSASIVQARNADTDNEQSSVNRLIVQEWLQDNFALKLKNKGGQLELAGLLTFQASGRSETINGNQLIGRSRFCERPNISYDIGMVWSGLYQAERSWGSFYIDMSNLEGIIGGEESSISLDRAYLGYRLLQRDDMTLDINVGRRFLGDVLSSTIQFNSQLDGIDMRWTKVSPLAADLYVQATAFVVDASNSQWAWAAEFGALGIGESGWNFQLSFIDWNHRGCSRSPDQDLGPDEAQYDNPRYRFANLQPQVSYEWNLDYGELQLPLSIYAGVSYNLSSQALLICPTDNPAPCQFYSPSCCTNQASCCDACPAAEIYVGKTPWAGFIGLTGGNLGKVGDWAFDLHYEYVQAQSIPQFDMAGIGMGNCPGFDFYSSGMGDTNFQGVFFRILQQVTRHITLQAMMEYSRSLDSCIGCPRTYLRGRVGCTYAF